MPNTHHAAADADEPGSQRMMQSSRGCFTSWASASSTPWRRFLGLSRSTRQTRQGFGCFDCHAHAPAADTASRPSRGRGNVAAWAASPRLVEAAGRRAPARPSPSSESTSAWRAPQTIVLSLVLLPRVDRLERRVVDADQRDDELDLVASRSDCGRRAEERARGVIAVHHRPGARERRRALARQHEIVHAVERHAPLACVSVRTMTTRTMRLDDWFAALVADAEHQRRDAVHRRDHGARA